MSEPEKAVFVNVANTLKRRADRGRAGTTIEDMLQAADKVLESHSAGGREQLLAAIADARATIAGWRESGNRSELIAKLSAMAVEAESQGHVLGNRLLTEVGTRMSAFVSLLANAAATGDAKAAIVVKLHLDAMVVAVDRKQEAALDEAGRTLLNNLELTQRTIKG